MSDFDESEGWCGGHTVHMDEGQTSEVLGPDGEPVKYVRRHVAGFDLRPKSPPVSARSGKIIAKTIAKHRPTLKRLAEK